MISIRDVDAMLLWREARELIYQPSVDAHDKLLTSNSAEHEAGLAQKSTEMTVSNSAC